MEMIKEREDVKKLNDSELFKIPEMLFEEFRKGNYAFFGTNGLREANLADIKEVIMDLNDKWRGHKHLIIRKEFSKESILTINVVMRNISGEVPRVRVYSTTPQCHYCDELITAKIFEICSRMHELYMQMLKNESEKEKITA